MTSSAFGWWIRDWQKETKRKIKKTKPKIWNSLPQNCDWKEKAMKTPTVWRASLLNWTVAIWLSLDLLQNLLCHILPFHGSPPSANISNMSQVPTANQATTPQPFAGSWRNCLQRVGVRFTPFQASFLGMKQTNRAREKLGTGKTSHKSQNLWY